MRSRSLAGGVALALIAGLLTSAELGFAAPPGPERRFIVVLADGADQAQVAARSRRPARKFRKALNAVAVSIPSTDLGALRSMPGVAAVYPDNPVKVHTDVSVPLIGAPQVWQQRDPAGTAVKGKGINIAVIDSGVDYTHPDLGGGFGEGFKVVGGYDFVNNDADPMDDNGHGTHVAGIIAGRAAQPGGITGVAPEANILAYKVMNEWGEGYESDIIAGIEAAIDPANPHRADVINMSLGGSGDGTDPIGLAASAAVKAGVVVVASAGNSGPGSDTIGSPAAADGVIAVGASTSGLSLPSAYLAGPKPQLIQTFRGAHTANPPASPVTAQLVDVGSGSPEELDAAGDLHGKIVRVQAFVPEDPSYLSMWDIEFARELESRGVVAMLGGFPGGGGGPVLAATRNPATQQDLAAEGVARVAATGAGRLHASGDLLRMDKIVVLGVDGLQFDELGTRLAAGRVDVTVKGQDQTDQIASFSSRGPSPSFGLKPDLVAPGVDIKSTVPTSLFAPGQYRMSGTSMASPHVAGAAALLRQLHPAQSPAEIRSELVGSAKALSGTRKSTQGSGRLDLAAAAAVTVTSDPASVSFGLADLSQPNLRATREVTLRNSSNRFQLIRVTGDSRVKVSPELVFVLPGRTAKVTVSLKADRPEGYAEIDGSIKVTPSYGPEIHLAYLLVARPLIVQASPDPSDGPSTAYIASPTSLGAAPVLTVTPPRGKPVKVAATPLYGNYYTADLPGSAPGVYRVAVEGTATTGQKLIGDTAFQVTDPGSRNDRWAAVGPYSEAGDVTLSPSSPKSAVMSQYNSAGLWSTSDSGQTWQQLNRLPLNGAGGLGKVVIDAKNPSRWWYSALDTMTGASKIMRTTDNGRTFRALSIPQTYVKTLVSDPQTRALVAVTYNGLLISTDGGDTWSAQPSGVDGEVSQAAIVGDTLYLATYDSIWAKPGILSGTPGAAKKIYDTAGKFLASFASDGQGLAALIWGVGVVSSQDGGLTWATVVDIRFGAFTLFGSNGDFYLSASAGAGYVSHDHGRQWTQIAAPNDASVPMDFEKWADGSFTVSAEAAGVYRSQADGTYRRIGVQGGTVHDLVAAGGQLLAGTDQGTYRTAVPAASPEWGATGGEGYIGVTTRFMAVSPKDPNVVWRVRLSAFGSFMLDRSSDAGLTWEEKGSWAETPTALVISPADPERVTVSFNSLLGAGLFSTVNGGSTWRNLRQSMPFNALAADPVNPDRLWLGNPSGLYRSDDGGVTVTKVSDTDVTSILLDGPRLMIGGSTIQVSTDGGRTFREGDTGLLPTRVNHLIRSGSALYAATSAQWLDGVLKGGRGVLRSTDNGRTWQNVSTGLENLNATRLAVSADGKWLFVGTVSGGVHRMSLRN